MPTKTSTVLCCGADIAYNFRSKEEAKLWLDQQEKTKYGWEFKTYSQSESWERYLFGPAVVYCFLDKKQIEAYGKDFEAKGYKNVTGLIRNPRMKGRTFFALYVKVINPEEYQELIPESERKNWTWPER